MNFKSGTEAPRGLKASHDISAIVRIRAETYIFFAAVYIWKLANYSVTF